MVVVGGIGVTMLLGMNIIAAWGLIHGPSRPDAGVIEFGVFVGFVVSVVYCWAAREFFRIDMRHDA
ncbi:hypothetical protein BWI17_03825 [Betaproteobacteria bacterium GR16-43]|nr:hypothetical protein BWI17_03825 [Betaproteobacteria bacterium GR16-43]